MSWVEKLGQPNSKSALSRYLSFGLNLNIDLRGIEILHY